MHESSFVPRCDALFKNKLAAAYEKATGIKVNHEVASVGSVPASHPDSCCHKIVTTHGPVAKDPGKALGRSMARECGRFRKRRCGASTLALAARLRGPGERRVARGRHRARDRRHEVVQ
jgi:hypothetical protein